MFATGVKGALWLAFSSVVAGLGQERIISPNATGSVLQIAGGSVSTGQILVAPDEYWGVVRAAHDLARDFGRVTGINYTVSNGEAGAAPITYTYNPINNKNNTFVSRQNSSGNEGLIY